MPDAFEFRGLTLEQIETYIAVVETGSLTRAAARLGVGKTAVTKTIQRLEAKMGASLIVRTTRRIRVTEPGQVFFEGCSTVVVALRSAVTAARPATDELRGLLRVGASIEFGALVLAPVLARLRALHPALRLELVSDDRFVDVVESGVDVILRLGRLVDSSCRAIEIGRSRKWLMASPAFVAGHPLPDDVSDVTRLPAIGLSTFAQPLRFTLESTVGKRCDIVFTNAMLANTMHGCRAACAAGAGVALLPDFAVTSDVDAGRLVRVFADWASEVRPINVVLPPGKFTPPEARAFIDLLKSSCTVGGQT